MQQLDGRNAQHDSVRSADGGTAPAIHLEELLGGITDGVYVQDAAGQLVYANLAVARTLGFDSVPELYAAQPDAALDRFDLIDETGNPFPLANLPGRLALQNKESGEATVKFRMRTTGKEHWAIIRATPILDARGQIQFTFNNYHDITDLKAVEARLREKEDEYRSIFDATSDGLVINDLDGSVVEVNPAFCRMHGYTREEFLGMHPSQFIHPDDQYLFQDYVEAIQAGEIYECRAVDVRKDGSTFYVGVRGSMFTYMGRPHILGVVRDVTHQVKAEQLLEQQVAERTRELSALLDVSQHVASILELPPLLALILDQLRLVADYTGAAIGTLDEATLTLLDSRGPDGPEPESIGRRIPMPLGNLVADAIRRGEPVIIPDVRGNDPLSRACRELSGDRLEAPSLSYIRSWLMVPLLLKDRVIGLVSLSRDEPDYYTSRHAHLAMAIAGQAAVAIENARLFQEAQEAARKTAALAQIAASVALAGSLETTLSRLASSVVQATGAAASAVLLLEGDPPVAHMTGTFGFAPEWIAAYDEAMRNGARDISRRAIREGHPVVMRNAREAIHAFPEWAPVHELMKAVTWDTYVSLPLVAREHTLGALAICYEPDDDPDDSEIAFLSTVADQAAVAVENARLFDQTQQRMREIEALYRADERLYGSLQTSEVLEALVDVAMDILEADKSTVMIWDEQHEHLLAGAARGFKPETVAKMIHAPGEGITSLVAMTGQPLAVADATTDPRVAHRITDGEDIRSLIHVPIIVDNEIFGVFGVNYCRPHSVGEHERRVLQALAQRAALAIDNAQLYSQAQQVAALEERQRLARELHDSVSQALYGIALGARTARTMLDRDPAGAVAPTDYVLSLAEAGLAEMRALIFELRPESLEREGLVAALQRQATLLRTRHSLDVQTDLCDEPEMTLDSKEAFYRIAQEAMNNIVKHARATEVVLRLALENGEIVLEVRDNGAGFDPHGAFPGHLGLRSMSERMTRLHGTLEIESGPGRGTCVRARLNGMAAAQGATAGRGRQSRARSPQATQPV